MQRSVSREQIVAATLDMLSTRGFEALSVSHVAAHMGVPPMALYAHFSGRDDLLDVAEETIFRDFKVLAAGEGWHERIHAWLDAIYTLFQRWPIALKLIDRNDRISPAWLRIWSPVVDLLRGAGLSSEGLAFALFSFENMVLALMIGLFRESTGMSIDKLLNSGFREGDSSTGDLIVPSPSDRKRAFFEQGVEMVMGALERLLEPNGFGYLM